MLKSSIKLRWTPSIAFGSPWPTYFRSFLFLWWTRAGRRFVPPFPNPGDQHIPNKKVRSQFYFSCSGWWSTASNFKWVTIAWPQCQLGDRGTTCRVDRCPRCHLRHLCHHCGLLLPVVPTLAKKHQRRWTSILNEVGAKVVWLANVEPLLLSKPPWAGPQESFTPQAGKDGAPKMKKSKTQLTTKSRYNQRI